MELNFPQENQLPGHWSEFLVGWSLRIGASSEVVGKMGGSETGSAERSMGFLLTKKQSVHFRKLGAFVLA